MFFFQDASGRVDWRDGAVEGRLRDCEQESVTEPLVQACHGQVNAIVFIFFSDPITQVESYHH